MRPKVNRICVVPDCEKTNVHSRGLCDAHYTEARRRGTVKQYPALDGEMGERRGQIASEKLRGRKFSDERRRAMSAAKVGKKLSPEHRQKLSEVRRGEKHTWGPLTEKMRLHLIKARAAKGPTRLELALRTLLDEMGVVFVEQFPIGNHTVDVYVPKIKLVIEADGAYWHQSPAKDASRDAYLLRNPLVDAVVHIPEDKLKRWIPVERWDRQYRTAT